MRILMTNHTLRDRAGSELWTRDLALALMHRGHDPILYSTVLGDVADELLQAGVPVVDTLAAVVAPPDVIHGHHHMETVTAALRFPLVPTISVCHGWAPWEETPPILPSIAHHVAVDDLCRERLLTTAGVNPAAVSTRYNFVDTERFRPRQPLPGHPSTALVLSNYADYRHVEAVRAGCAASGISRVDVVGASSGSVVARPEDILGSYDVVFAKARGALEAMAVGCAVVVTDVSGLAGMVTKENLDELLPLNFGLRTLQRAPVTPQTVERALQDYDAQSAGEVSSRIRSEAALADAVVWWEALYAQACDQWAPGPGHELRQLAAASSYLQALSLPIKSVRQAHEAAAQANVRLAAANAELAELRRSSVWRAVDLYRTGRARVRRRR